MDENDLERGAFGKPDLQQNEAGGQATYLNDYQSTGGMAPMPQ